MAGLAFGVFAKLCTPSKYRYFPLVVVAGIYVDTCVFHLKLLNSFEPNTTAVTSQALWFE